MKEFNQHSLEDLQKLAKIRLSEDEKTNLLDSLRTVLEYMKQLSTIDTKDVPTCNHVSQVQNILREDEVGEILQRDVFLNNSPDQIGGMIRVPSVMKQD